MKKSMIPALAFIFAAIIYTSACKPNGNNNSTDVHNSMGEGIDTTHLINQDSTYASPYNHDSSANSDTLNTKSIGH